MELKGRLNNAQIELLKLFTRDVSEEDLYAIKKIIAAYLGARAIAAIDEVWDEKGWTNETMEQFLKTHMRTPYNRGNK